MPLPSVFTNYSSQMLYRSDADKAHVWQIAFIEFFVFALPSFVLKAPNGAFMSKHADPPIVVNSLTGLKPMPGRLAHLIDHLGISSIICKMGLSLG